MIQGQLDGVQESPLGEVRQHGPRLADHGQRRQREAELHGVVPCVPGNRVTIFRRLGQIWQHFAKFQGVLACKNRRRYSRERGYQRLEVIQFIFSFASLMTPLRSFASSCSNTACRYYCYFLSVEVYNSSSELLNQVCLVLKLKLGYRGAFETPTSLNIILFRKFVGARYRLYRRKIQREKAKLFRCLYFYNIIYRL